MWVPVAILAGIGLGLLGTAIVYKIRSRKRPKPNTTLPDTRGML